MSRLDSFIQRLQAQRACLDAAAAMIADLPGPALELGLGNGRTYDHLRALLPGRRIFVFEREVRAQPDCVPPEADLFLGDFTGQLPGAMARIGEPAALIHADIGTGDKAASLALARSIAGAVVDLMRPGAVLLSDQPFSDPRLRPAPLPEGVQPGRYHLSIATE